MFTLIKNQKMNKFTPYFLSAKISLVIILLTGWIAFSSNISILQEICFYFHLIPFGIGFSGGSTLLIILYYLALLFVVSLITFPLVQIYYSSKNKRIILISTFSILSLIFLTVIWFEHSIKREREERMLLNEKEDKKEFESLKTGDIIFQTPNKINPQVDSDTLDNKIAIINVDIHGYTVLEITD